MANPIALKALFSPHSVAALLPLHNSSGKPHSIVVVVRSLSCFDCCRGSIVVAAVSETAGFR